MASEKVLTHNLPLKSSAKTLIVSYAFEDGSWTLPVQRTAIGQLPSKKMRRSALSLRSNLSLLNWLIHHNLLALAHRIQLRWWR